MNAYEKSYLAREVESASPAKQILMLYDGALAAIRRAEKEISEKRVPEAHHQLVKAQDIILALSNNLNMDQGGVISQNLFLLYDFMYEAMVRANLTKDVAPLQKVKEILSEIRDGWDQGVIKNNPPPVTAVA